MNNRRALLLSVAALLLLAAIPGSLFLLRLRSKWEWNAVAAAARAAGRLPDLSPPIAIPAAENLLARPFFAPWVVNNEAWTTRVHKLILPFNFARDNYGEWLKHGAPFNGNEELLQQKLREQHALLDEIRDGLKSAPRLQLILNDEPEAAPDQFIWHVCRLLRYRALIALEEQRGDDVLQDTLAALDLMRSPVPGGVSAFPRSRCLPPFQQVIATGLASGQWSDAGIMALQARLEAMQPLRDALASLDAYNATTLDFLDRNPDLGRSSSSPPPFPPDWLQNLRDATTPAPDTSRNKLQFLRTQQQLGEPCFVVNEGRIDTHAFARFESEVDALPRSLGPAAVLLSNTRSIVRSTALLQNFRNQAIVACALERYRRAHGSYPERLEALLPDYAATLPVDVIDGQPLRYRRLGDGSYLLYSIALNHTDNGGVIEILPGKEKITDEAPSADWVWRLPTVDHP